MLWVPTILKQRRGGHKLTVEFSPNSKMVNCVRITPRSRDMQPHSNLKQ